MTKKTAGVLDDGDVRRGAGRAGEARSQKSKRAVFFLLAAGLMAQGFPLMAQDAGAQADNSSAATPRQVVRTPANPADKPVDAPPKPAAARGGLVISPIFSSHIWDMTSAGGAGAAEQTDDLAIARSPAESLPSGLPRPAPQSVYFGVPPKSASSIVSLGVVGVDVDYFLSTTSFAGTDYRAGFGYVGFDRDSLSVGVSRKFTNGAVTSLYYNGNIIEDIFAYIANNSLTNGSVGLGASESVESDYQFMGDLKDRNNINSRSNIDLLFGIGAVGFDFGYSQKLFGMVKKSDASAVLDTTAGTYTIEDTRQAVLDNALAPHVEFGFNLGGGERSLNIVTAFQVDIHQHRELSKGIKYVFPAVATPATTITSVTDKLVADYMEPSVTIRLGVDFPTDEASRMGLALETGTRLRFYSNMDDKGSTVNGAFWSKKEGIGGTDGYTASITKRDIDLELLARPSLRYLTQIKQLKVGLSGGFGAGFKIGTTTTKTYKWIDYTTYLADADPYIDANLIPSGGALEPMVAEMPGIDMGLYPNLGVGFSFDIVPSAFAINGGVGATQTLYRLRTGEREVEVLGVKTKTPILEQSWGKPLAQFALGAAFSFKDNYMLDAVFSSNGTALDGANFVVQFSARF